MFLVVASRKVYAKKTSTINLTIWSDYEMRGSVMTEDELHLVKTIDGLIKKAQDNNEKSTNVQFVSGAFSNRDNQLMIEKHFPNYRFIWDEQYDNCGISWATYLKIMW